MLALTLAAPRRFEFTEQDEPAAPAPDEALVCVRAVGACGTDEAAFLGKMPLIQCPRILGHELGVEVVEPDRRRRDFVRGHCDVARVHETPESAGPADVAFDATGQAASMSRAPECATFGGRVVYVGLTAEPLVLNDHLLHRRELTLHASRNALKVDFRRLLELMEQGRIQVRSWITHRIPLAEVPAELPRLLETDTGKIKAVIVLPFATLAPPPLSDP